MTHYHFMGIGGIGMSALAHILLDEKQEVSGFDHSFSKIVAHLRERGAKIMEEGFPSDATIVYSTALQSHPQLGKWQEQGAHLLHRSQLLFQLMQGKTSIAVTGTHGKTTTSSLLAHIFLEGGFDPSFAFGGLFKGINGRRGGSPYFIFEADESDGSFLNYFPSHAIVTNIEKDHLEYFSGQEEKLRSAFAQFVEQVQGELFYCGDTLSYKKGTSYGFSAGCTLRINGFTQKGWAVQFGFTFEGKEYRDVQLPLIGVHNVRNAAACFGLALRLGLKEEEIRKALASFPGVSRRCEKRSEIMAISHYDDYAHHPTKVRFTLEAIREAIGERRLVVLYQPHRYTRISQVFEEHQSSFKVVDHLFISEIYGAGEKPLPGITGEALAQSVGATYLPQARWDELNDFVRPHDVFVSMGAGDVTYFQLQPRRKYKVGLVYGGKSLEHEISERSAKNVLEHLSSELYDVHRFYIDKAGLWNGQPLESEGVMKKLAECEIFFPIMHGSYGEDGRIQALFELLEIPYVGPRWAACALTMNKMQCKQVARDVGVPTPHGFCFGRGEAWQERARQLQLPLYVKPNHLGSSLGVSRVESYDMLEDAVAKVFAIDDRVLIEEGKEKCRELEFGVVGERVIQVSPGEKMAGGAFVDYAMKYTPGLLKADPAPFLPPALLEKGKQYAAKIYQALECSSFARVDFLLDPEGNFWFFEINPIPGMTPLSLFPRVFEKEGIPFSKLLDQMVISATYRKRTCHY